MERSDNFEDVLKEAESRPKIDYANAGKSDWARLKRWKDRCFYGDDSLGIDFDAEEIALNLAEEGMSTRDREWETVDRAYLAWYRETAKVVRDASRDTAQKCGKVLDKHAPAKTPPAADKNPDRRFVSGKSKGLVFRSGGKDDPFAAGDVSFIAFSPSNAGVPHRKLGGKHRVQGDNNTRRRVRQAKQDRIADTRLQASIREVKRGKRLLNDDDD